MEQHIHKLRKHRNVLYSIVFILLILQIAFFVSLSLQISKLNSSYESLSNEVDENSKSVQEEINLLRQENQFSINELASEVSEQGKDIQGQINLLKNTQVDFSGVIEDVIKGVVSVSTDKSAASGFIISENGYIVTNNHVTSGANFIKVQSFNGQTYDAILVGSDSLNDVALLKVSGSFQHLSLGNSDNVQTGEKVIAIGNPLGLSFSVTEGIVSGTKRVGPNGLAQYIQTDVTLNPGNSGGPLINREGEVVGMSNFKIGNAESLGFALEINIIKEKANAIANMSLAS